MNHPALRLFCLGALLAAGAACSSREPVTTTSTTTTHTTAVEPVAPVAPVGGTSSTTTTVLGGGR